MLITPRSHKVKILMSFLNEKLNNTPLFTFSLLCLQWMPS